MDPREIAELIAQVGFPIAVAIYLLVRMDMLLREIMKSLTRLTNALNTLNIRLGPHLGSMPEDLP